MFFVVSVIISDAMLELSACVLMGSVGTDVGCNSATMNIQFTQRFASIRLGTTVFPHTLFIDWLSRLVSMTSIRSGGTTRVSAFDVVTIFDVTCWLQLQCSTTGSETSFTVTIEVVMMFAAVVSSVFMTTIVQVRFLWTGLNSRLTALSRLLVTLDPLSMTFTKAKNGTVSRALPSSRFYSCLGTVRSRPYDRPTLLFDSGVSLIFMMKNSSLPVVSVKVIGQFSSRNIIRSVNTTGVTPRVTSLTTRGYFGWHSRGRG